MAASWTNGLMGVVLLAAAMPGGAAAAPDPLGAYRGKARILVAVASQRDDPRLARQRSLFAGMKAGANERDLVLVEAADPSPEAKALRAAFDLRDGFQAVLVGKDGGGKLTSSEPLGPDQLFPLIDSMPMRQDEMQRR